MNQLDFYGNPWRIMSSGKQINTSDKTEYLNKG